MKLKKALSSLLALVLLLSCMSITAFAEGETITVTSDLTTWDKAGTYVVNGNVEINGSVTISAAVTLNIAKSNTLTIKGTDGSEGGMDFEYDNLIYPTDGTAGIAINNGGALTVNCDGTLNVTGGNGGYFAYTGSGIRANGAHGIAINNGGTMTVNGTGTLSVTGGKGGGGNDGINFGNDGTGIMVGGTFNMTNGYLKCDSFGNSDGYTRGITGGYFSSSVSDYVAYGYECVDNTDSETSSDYRYTVSEIKTTGDVNLDLEEPDATYPDHKDIDQYYTKVEARETVYKHKIRVQSSHTTMNIKVADTKQWNPVNLSWDTDDAKIGVATVDGETNKVTYTLTNYSAKAFTCSLTFAADSAVEGKFTSYAVDAENVELAAVANDITQPDVKLDTSVPTTATITATITPTLEGDGSFAGAEATTSAAKYGVFTVKCTAVTE